MRQIILPFAVLLFGSTVYAQVDPGHSILRGAAFSRSSSCADGSCGTPAASDFEATSGYTDPAFASCPDGNCGLRTAYSQPVTANDGGCADGSCGLSASYVSGNSNYVDYETAASYTGCESGACADGRCALPVSYSQPMTANVGGCADGSCNLPANYIAIGSCAAYRPHIDPVIWEDSYPANYRGYATTVPAFTDYPTASTVSSATTATTDGCADGSCSLKQSFAAPRTFVRGLPVTTNSQREAAVLTTADNREFYSDVFPTSYLDGAASGEYTNHVSVIRRKTDVESTVFSAGGTSAPLSRLGPKPISVQLLVHHSQPSSSKAP